MSRTNRSQSLNPVRAGLPIVVFSWALGSAAHHAERAPQHLLDAANEGKPGSSERRILRENAGAIIVVVPGRSQVERVAQDALWLEVVGSGVHDVGIADQEAHQGIFRCPEPSEIGP